MIPEGFRVFADTEHAGRLCASCSVCGSVWSDLENVCEALEELSVGALQELRCHRETHGEGEARPARRRAREPRE